MLFARCFDHVQGLTKATTLKRYCSISLGHSALAYKIAGRGFMHHVVHSRDAKTKKVNTRNQSVLRFNLGYKYVCNLCRGTFNKQKRRFQESQPWTGNPGVLANVKPSILAARAATNFRHKASLGATRGNLRTSPMFCCCKATALS